MRATRNDMAAVACAVMAALAAAEAARAEPGHVLNGLFCNTEAQIDATLELMRQAVPPQSAVEMINLETVACVFADRVQYMVTDPVVLAELPADFSLIKYQATLVGVLVGDSIRPVEPPVGIFFVTPERLPGAMIGGGA